MGYVRTENLKYTIRLTVLEPHQFMYLGSDDYNERCNGLATPKNKKTHPIIDLKQDSSNDVCNGKKKVFAPKQVKELVYKGKILEENSPSLKFSLNELEKEKMISDFEKNEKKNSEKNANQGKLFRGTGFSPAEYERRMIEIRKDPLKI